MPRHRTVLRRPPRLRAIGAAGLALAAAVGTALGVSLNSGGAGAASTTTYPLPADDPFYASPANLTSYANGTIIRSRAVDSAVSFLGSPQAGQAWQLAFRSNDAHNRPITAVTTIVVPTAKYTGKAASRPLVAYQAAEDSTGSQCAPSYTLHPGSNVLTSSEQSLMALALMKGFAMDISDYEGPNSAFMVGPQGGRIVLDSIRASQSFTAAGLSKQTPVGLWGYSGGGHATAWAAELQSSYAPDLTSIKGYAYGGVPTNLQNTLNKLNGGPIAGFAIGPMVGLSHAYPEWGLVAHLNAKGQQVYNTANNACVADFATKLAFTDVNTLTTGLTISDPITQSIFAADNLGQATPVAPIYDFYSTFDEAIPTADSEALIRKYCAAGAKVIAQPVILSDHSTLTITKAPDVVSFLNDRFDGKPLQNVCKIGLF